jgi:hypothetical protein
MFSTASLRNWKLARQKSIGSVSDSRVGLANSEICESVREIHWTAGIRNCLLVAIVWILSFLSCTIILTSLLLLLVDFCTFVLRWIWNLRAWSSWFLMKLTDEILFFFIMINFDWNVEMKKFYSYTLFEMGFGEQINEIVNTLPNNSQTLLSAKTICWIPQSWNWWSCTDMIGCNTDS